MTETGRPGNETRGRKVQVALYLYPAQRLSLKRLSVTTRVPQQVYLREAIDDLLDKYKLELRA